jgi:hypothetical protein
MWVYHPDFLRSFALSILVSRPAGNIQLAASASNAPPSFQRRVFPALADGASSCLNHALLIAVRDTRQSSQPRIRTANEAIEQDVGIRERLIHHSLTDKLLSEVMEETGFRIQVTGARAAAMLNCELWIVSCLLTSGHRRLPTDLREALWGGLNSRPLTLPPRRADCCGGRVERRRTPAPARREEIERSQRRGAKKPEGKSGKIGNAKLETGSLALQFLLSDF